MQRSIGRFSERMYAVMRIVVGLLFACHGAQKILGLLGGQRVDLVSLYGLAGLIELLGGVLVAIGLLTSWAAFVASGLMAVAYFMAHFPKGFWPIRNGGELAVLYCFVFLFIAVHGDGPWSVGSRRRQPGR
jgi:putative oxidoreductase